METSPNYVVQLNFQPKGNGHADEPFYLADKENRCVVCGAYDDLTSHHCVPYCFRKWFPDYLKQYASHDNLIVCVSCHRKYEHIAGALKRQMFCKASDQTPTDVQRLGWNSEKGVGAAITIIRHSEKIPRERLDQLYDLVRECLGKTDITEDDLKGLAVRRLRNKKQHDSSKLMGKAVVDNLHKVEELKPYLESPLLSLWRHFLDYATYFRKDRKPLPNRHFRAFIKLWRFHFLRTMKPQFMPAHWDVNHRM